MCAYQVRLAESGDRGPILDFLREEWKADHIFLKSNELLDWQHLDSQRGALNFVVAVEDNSRRLLGILGFIPVARFDRKLSDAKDYWGALWKGRSAGGVPGVGLELLDYFERTLQPRSLGMIGVTPHAEKIYRALGFRTGMLDRFYVINPDMRTFKLVAGHAQEKGLDTVKEGTGSIGVADLRDCDGRLEAFVAAGNQGGLPQKSAEYLRNRYERHPIYRYNLFGIEQAGRECGVLVCRVAEHEGARALRIVDLKIRNDCRRLMGTVFKQLVSNFEAEYADFYYAGVSKTWAEGAGVKILDVNAQLILPSYFEPFTAKNVDLRYAVKAPQGQVYEIFRGDADQDRPNLVIANTTQC